LKFIHFQIHQVVRKQVLNRCQGFEQVIKSAQHFETDFGTQGMARGTAMWCWDSCVEHPFPAILARGSLCQHGPVPTAQMMMAAGESPSIPLLVPCSEEVLRDSSGVSRGGNGIVTVGDAEPEVSKTRISIEQASSQKLSEGRVSDPRCCMIVTVPGQAATMAICTVDSNSESCKLNGAVSNPLRVPFSVPRD
jgi:hypothetical protein